MKPSFLRIVASTLAASVLSLALCAARDEPAAGPGAPWVLAGEPVAWEIKGKVRKGKDVSGAIMLARDHGVLVSDETRGVQMFTCDAQRGRVVIGGEIIVMPGDGSEVDFEGAALSKCGKFAYFTGSHSMARKKGVIQDSRSNVFRIPLDPGGSALEIPRASQGNFRKAIATLPGLAESIDKPADGTGLDIEGLAEADGRLFVGFRAPQLNGYAAVMEIGVDEVFGDGAGKPKPVAHRLDLGKGKGIRSLARVPDGFLVIAGNAGEDTESLDFTLFHWKGPGHSALPIGPIPNPPGKAESIMVLEAAESQLDCVLWFDGAENGGPHTIRLVPR